MPRHLTFSIAVAAACLAGAAGCRSPQSRGNADAEKVSKAETSVDEVAGRIRKDPVAYLREVAKRCSALERYRLTFIRQERLGLLPTLGKPDRILVRFRVRPFSVKFDFPDPDNDYAESVYVAGKNDDKLIVRERKGLMGLPPTIRRVNPIDSVIWGRSKRPITEFGLASMMTRSLATIDNPPKGVPAVITYAGLQKLEQTGVVAHHLVILRATTAQTPCNRQDLWIDVHSELPAGTCLLLPNGQVDALYLYADVQPDDSLSDEDFQLSVPDAPEPKAEK